MTSLRVFSVCIGTVLLLALPGRAQPAAGATTVVGAKAEKKLSLVRVNVTSQPYDFFRPWSKAAPYTRRGLGAVMPDKRVLVTAELVANATYLELEKAQSGAKTAATVDAIDYEADLALIKPVERDFLDSLEPLELAEAAVGDTVYTWQLESTGTLLVTSGLVTTIEVATYPVDEVALLVYRLTSSLQYREGSFVLPVVKNNKLIGLLMRYDARTQNVDLVPTPVIRHFLKSAERGKYEGFPRAGIEFAPMRDPQLRRHAGLDGETNGVYITEVLKDGAAEKAGIKVGDVLLAIDGISIDQDGTYLDPNYGKLSLINLVSTACYAGDKLTFELFREGKRQTVDLIASHKPASDYLIPPYVIGQAPPYYVLGGIVMQELSRQYLKEWGGDWLKQAPQRLVYYDRYASELFGGDDRKRLIILSQVLPTPDTIGYEQLGYLLVTKVNDREIKSLADVAEAAETPINGFHKIEFRDDPKVIFLDATQVHANEQALKENYGLPALHRGVEEPVKP